MITTQTCLTPGQDFAAALAPLAAGRPDLVLAFGSPWFFTSADFTDALAAALPSTVLAGCSAAGCIAGKQVHDESMVLTAIQFSRSRAAASTTALTSMADSHAAGKRLALGLEHAGLRAVLVLGTGLNINGTGLVSGLQANLPDGVSLSGGLASDGAAFQQTWTLSSTGAAADQLVAVGLYGDALEFAYGSFAGWTPFGPTRKVTRCSGNILHQLDGERALDVYRRYLGDYAVDLPASGLLFPFEMLGAEDGKRGVIRTILGIDEAAGALILAGEIDAEGFLRLMHSSTDKLIDGAETAAESAFDAGRSAPGGGLAILVSCIGRRLVMGDRCEEEVEAVVDRLGPAIHTAGFYSNGEIAAADSHGECLLHNQTMTISWFDEA